MLFKNIRVKFYYWRRELFKKQLLKKILKFSKNNKLSNEEIDAFHYINKNGLSIFPYSFSEKYSNLNIEVLFENYLPYVVHNEKKLFFKRGWNKDKVNHYYKSIVMEQDAESAHLYCDNIFKVEDGEILIDLGVAEGNFSIENIEKASSVYLLEKNLEWLEPLKETFKDYTEKVTVINKFAGSKNSESSVSLDSFPELYGKNIFIKIDVDGAERDVLKGMENLLRENQKIKIAICTYHAQNDEKEFEAFFKNLGFEVSFSPGFMLFYHDRKLKAPFLRRGILRAKKN